MEEKTIRFEVVRWGIQNIEFTHHGQEIELQWVPPLPVANYTRTKCSLSCYSQSGFIALMALGVSTYPLRPYWFSAATLKV